MDAFSFSCVKIIFGVDTIEKIPDEVARLKGSKVVVITSKSLKGVGKKICEKLENCELWSNIPPEPEIGIVDEIAQLEFDMVVGVGGGSTLDVAKLSAVIAGNKVSADELVGRKLPERRVKLILCPTTAGTGSEVTKLAVFKIPGRDVKYVFDDTNLYADVAVVDPNLTVSLPPSITASSGLDAICHAIEAYTSAFSNPITDMFAERAIETGCMALREAFANGKNLNARIRMSYASLLAGIAFNIAGTHLGHALGYAHSYIHNNPHGKSVAITLPYVLQYNAISDLKKHAKIASMLGGEIKGKSTRESASLAAKLFKDLLSDLGVPTKLLDVGAGEDDIPEIVKRIFESKKHIARNPRVVRKEEMYDLVRNAIYG